MHTSNESSESRRACCYKPLFKGLGSWASALLWLSACASDGADSKTPDSATVQPSGTFEESECPFPVPSGMIVQCGALMVPEDYAKADGSRLTLSVAIFKSASATPAPDPLVYLAGGPGAAAVAALAGAYPALAPILAERDLIAVDQRGTGFSTPALTCPELANVSDPSKLGDAVLACHDRLTHEGVDLARYTTANNARDMEALRRALRLDTWNVIGTSYGTRLALEMMRQNAASLRSVVLDSALSPDLDALAQTARAAARGFAQVFNACAADLACSQLAPNLESRFYALLAKLDQTPLDGHDSNGDTIAIHGSELLARIGALVYDVSGIPLIPAIVIEGEQGVTTTLEAAHLLDPMDDGLATAMNYSIVCSEFLPLTSADKVKEAEDGVQPEVVSVFNPDSYLTACPLWNVPAAPKDTSSPVHSDVPTLVLAGAFDPSTPPSWSEHVTETLGHAHYTLFQGATHGVLRTACGMQMVADFVNTPSAVHDPACAERESDALWTLAQGARAGSQAP